MPAGLELSKPIEYDQAGRMYYHPDFHHKHGVRLTEEELEYLCKYWEVDDRQTLSFALGKTEHTLSSKVNDLKKKSLYEYYKHLNKHW